MNQQNQNQKPQYDVNVMINELLNKNATLTFENAELKAIIYQMEQEEQEKQKQGQSAK